MTLFTCCGYCLKKILLAFLSENPLTITHWQASCKTLLIMSKPAASNSSAAPAS